MQYSKVDFPVGFNSDVIIFIISIAHRRLIYRWNNVCTVHSLCLHEQ